MIAAFLCAHCVSPVPPVVQLLTFPRPPRISLRAATALVTLDFSSHDRSVSPTSIALESAWVSA